MKKKSEKTAVPKAVREEVLRLHSHYGSREIAKRVGLSRRIVRRVLEEEGLGGPPPAEERKLEPYLEPIAERVRAGLTTTRILREIRGPDGKGYQGGRTILAQLVSRLRAQLPLQAKPKKVRRRFETGVAQELQIDWSPYDLWIGGELTKAHALGCLLCYSRKLHVRFYKNERQSTLLEGLAIAFEYFSGPAHRVVLDNMATAVLGRIGSSGKPLWHPRFLAFVEHYGFEPYACKVKDPDRKGKKEKSFRLLEDDFLKGEKFASWEDLNEQARVWLDETREVANLRVHGTTRRVPNEVWLEERELLIRLPEHRFAVFDEEPRLVDSDSTLSIAGTRYTVPSALANTSVPVRLYAEHFEVLDKLGRIAFTRRYVEERDKGRLQIDPSHYATLPRRPRANAERLDEIFLKRYPSLAPLVEGLLRKMKSLAHVHLRALLRLADQHEDAAFLAAATRAQEYRRFDANAVRRILERDDPQPEPPVVPLSDGGVAIDDLDAGSLEDYRDLDPDPEDDHAS